MYKIDKLLKQDRQLFHTTDLALLWEMDNKNTLYTTIKRYVQKGILIPIHKGFYSTVPTDHIDPIEVGIGALHRFAYVSCESILVEAGIIFQKDQYISLISDVSRTFSIGENRYRVRKIKQSILFNDCEIINKSGIFFATVERAVADLLYFNSHYYFDNAESIDWRKVKKIQEEINYL